MIDYTPIEIVQYIDVSQLAAGDGYGGGGGGGYGDPGVEVIPSDQVYFERRTDVSPSYYAVEASEETLPDGFVQSKPELFGNQTVYYWIQCVVDESGEQVNTPFFLFETTHSVVDNFSIEYRIVSDGRYFLPADTLFLNLNTDGIGVYWLYSLGSKITEFSYSVNSILGFGVGDYTFLYMLLPSGFLLYMGWKILKAVL